MNRERQNPREELPPESPASSPRSAKSQMQKRANRFVVLAVETHKSSREGETKVEKNVLTRNRSAPEKVEADEGQINSR